MNGATIDMQWLNITLGSEAVLLGILEVQDERRKDFGRGMCNARLSFNARDWPRQPAKLSNGDSYGMSLFHLATMESIVGALQRVFRSSELPCTAYRLNTVMEWVYTKTVTRFILVFAMHYLYVS